MPDTCSTKCDNWGLDLYEITPPDGPYFQGIYGTYVWSTNPYEALETFFDARRNGIEFRNPDRSEKGYAADILVEDTDEWYRWDVYKAEFQECDCDDSEDEEYYS